MSLLSPPTARCREQCSREEEDEKEEEVDFNQEQVNPGARRGVSKTLEEDPEGGRLCFR